MRPKIRQNLKVIVGLALVPIVLAINARRVSATDSEVISAAALEVGFTKGGRYVGYLDDKPSEILPHDFRPGGICLVLRNWVGATIGLPNCPNIVAWNLQMPDDMDWIDYHRGLARKYEHYAGSLTFSLPIYSLDGQRAYLHYDVWEGPLEGQGGFLTLEKRDGKWQAVGDDVVMMS